MHNTLTIEITQPDTVQDLETVRQLASERAYTQAVSDLVRRGVISVTYGAELLRIEPAAMREQLREQGIAVADYTPQALREEVDDALSDFDREIDHKRLMRTVANTTPLSELYKIDQLELLQQVYTEHPCG